MIKTYSMWKCNRGGLWTYTLKGETPPENSNGVPIRDAELIGEFEAEEGESTTDFFRIHLKPHLDALRKAQEPTIEWCLWTIAERGVDPNGFKEGHMASPEQLRVSIACQHLCAQKMHRDVVESVLDWMENHAIKGIIKSCLKKWES